MYATYFPLGKVIAYSFLSGTDVSWYRIVVPKAGTLSMATVGNLQTHMTLSDSQGKNIIVNNSGGENPRPISARVSEGTYYIQIDQSTSRSARAGEYGLGVILE
jgi:hypothetical protein